MEASGLDVSDVIGVYEVRGETTVRGSRPATHFRIGEGAGARNALLWRLDDGMLLAVYAYADLETLWGLAAQVEPCTQQAC